MESQWLQNCSLGASGGPLGATSASGASPEGLWGGPGLQTNSLFAAWGPPWAKSSSIAGLRGVPGRVPEAPGAAPGGPFFSHALAYGIYNVSRGDTLISFGLAEKSRWLSQPNQRK